MPDFDSTDNGFWDWLGEFWEDLSEHFAGSEPEEGWDSDKGDLDEPF